VNIILESGHEPSGLGQVRAEVSGLIRYDKLDVPVLPEQGLHLVALAGNPRADIRLLTRLVQEDRVVESRVLRVAQCAAYQPSAPIRSLGEAIAWLGAGEVAEIAFTAVVHGLLFEHVQGVSRVGDRWRASIAAAIWAREIGAVSRHRSTQTYLCGLLHDIGAHAARIACGDNAARLGVRMSPAEEDVFVREFGSHFGDVLSRRWSLPATIVECIENWADWDPARQADSQVSVVHLAHHLAEIVTLQGAEFAREALSGNAALDYLNVSPDRFASLLERTTWVMSQVRAY
jgi:HD-like signal output (HDOD) protein